VNAATQPRNGGQFIVVRQDKAYLEDALSRFFDKVSFEENGCWLWTSGLDLHGYGNFRLPHTTARAHRWLYSLVVGTPKNVLDHLCRTRHCVNIDHLEDVTVQTNTVRGINANASKTHCPQGHPYDLANTYIHSTGRKCRTCTNENARRYRREKAVSP